MLSKNGENWVVTNISNPATFFILRWLYVIFDFRLWFRYAICFYLNCFTFFMLGSFIAKIGYMFSYCLMPLGLLDLLTFSFGVWWIVSHLQSWLLIFIMYIQVLWIGVDARSLEYLLLVHTTGKAYPRFFSGNMTHWFTDQKIIMEFKAHTPQLNAFCDSDKLHISTNSWSRM